MTFPPFRVLARAAAMAAAVTAAAPLSGCAQPAPDAPLPLETRMARPGRWELQGARYVWVEPDRYLQRVDPGRVVPGRWVWRSGQYVWGPARVVVIAP